MPVEIFNNDLDPSTRLTIDVYNKNGDLTPSWWLEIVRTEQYDVDEIRMLIDCTQSIAKQLERVIEYLS
jgi:hypothetical protein